MVKNIRFATVQDYLDCDNARLTAVWAKPPDCWANPNFKAKMVAKFNTPEFKKKKSDFFKNRWSDPVYKAQMVAKFNTPEYKKKQSDVVKKRWANPEYKKKRSDVVKKRWANPEYKAKMLAQRNTPEYKKMVLDSRRLKQKMKAAQ